MEEGTFREIDHTGDLGMEVVSRDLPGLFSRAALAMGEILYDPSVVGSREEIGMFFRGQDHADLMVRFLGEILYLFEARELLFHHFKILLVEPARLRAVGFGEGFDTNRHRIRASIKAVTYHRAQVESKREGEWRAVVILDV